MVEEQVAIILIFYCFYLVWASKREVYIAIKNKSFKSSKILVPLVIALISISYFLASRYVKSIFFPINPEYSAEYKALWNWSVLGIKSDPVLMPFYVLVNPFNAFNALFYDFPMKFLFVLFLFAPLAFLPLRSSCILITIAWLGPALLSNNPSYYTPGSQYPTYIIPFIFLASINSVKIISKDNLKVALALSKILIILIPIITLGLSPISPFPKFFNPQYVPPQITEHERILQQAIILVPSNASILTQNNIFPHVSSRSNAYAVYTHPAMQFLKEKIFAFTNNLTSKVEYILVDLTSDPSASAVDYVLGRVANGNYGLYFSGDRILLFKLNYTGNPQIYAPILENYNFLKLHLIDGNSTFDPTSESGTVLFHSTKAPSTNFFWSGPYTRLPSGKYKVSFKLKVGSIREGRLITLDAAVNGGKKVLASKDLSLRDFEEPLKWQNFTLTFELDQPYVDVEFRGLNHSNLTEIYLDYIQLTQQA